MMDGMSERSAAARKVLRELASELVASIERSGQTLSWTAAERAILDAVAVNIDRRVDLAADYAAQTGGLIEDLPA
jgi:hypothetical protein